MQLAAKGFSMSFSLSIYLQAVFTILMAINLAGILPIYHTLTESMDEVSRRKLTGLAICAGFGLALAFVFAGHFIFTILRITINDLRVGGGLVLLVLSITNLVFGDFRNRKPSADNELGVVPIGIPLIIGPSAITTIIVTQQNMGYVYTVLSLLTNLLVVYTTFYFAPSVIRKLGTGTAKASAKVASLFLAATAVAMIRKGIFGMLR